MKVHPFDLRQVRLLDGPVKQALEINRRTLKEWDPERLLHTFRLNAGLPSTAKPLGGWESPNCEVRGHFVGHYLSACAMMYASTGDDEFKRRADNMVGELAKCQQALGGEYLSAFPASFFDRLERHEGVWAPYYVIHKIMAGLLDVYQYCGNQQALEMATGMASYFQKRTDKLSDQEMAAVLNVEYGGMNEVLYNLYSITGDPAHLKLAHRFDHEHLFGPLADGRDELTGLHVNTQIPKIIGAARCYQLTGDARYRDIAEFFWNQVALHRAYCTGGTSNHEGWRTPPDKLATELSFDSQETCCTYNMLRLTRSIFGWSPEARYADYYERAFFNGILPTQDPQTGMFMYYVCLMPGGYKVFCTPDDSYWCCTATGIESFSKLGDSIYFHDDQGLYVNLFVASEVNWQEKGLILRQGTRFPEEESTSLTLSVKEPVKLDLHLRIPYWTSAPTLKVNGEAVDIPLTPGSYATLTRVWSSGDRVDLLLPMSLHLHRMPDDADLAALMYGPVVLAGDLGTEGLTREKQFLADQRAYDATPVKVPVFTADSDDLTTWVKPVPGEPLTFSAQGVRLIPFYRLFGKRYSIYWRILHRDSEAHRLPGTD